MARTRTRPQEDDKTGQKEKQGKEQRWRRDEKSKNDIQLATRKDRPTPSARDAKPRGVGSTRFINRIPVIGTIVSYFSGVVTEMGKVTWPTRDEAIHLTSVVLSVTIAFAIGLGLLDGFFSWWFEKAFHADTQWIFMVIAAVITVVLSGTYVIFRKRI